MKGTIFNIQHCAIHDGPGIRTTVFFKGCPLSCWWCHNPEGKNFSIEKVNGAMIGQEISATNLMNELLKDQVFYDESDGGVTFSGGEPLSQPEFLMEMLTLCRENGIHTVVDTCGFAEQSLLEKIIGLTDMLFFDLKIMDAEQHEKFTGVSNARILNNLDMLLKRKANVVLRVPLVPGITITDSNLKQIAEFSNKYIPGPIIDLIPFHKLAAHKYEKYNLVNQIDFAEIQPPDIEPIVSYFKQLGFTVNHE